MERYENRRRRFGRSLKKRRERERERERGKEGKKVDSGAGFRIIQGFCGRKGRRKEGRKEGRMMITFDESAPFVRPSWKR